VVSRDWLCSGFIYVKCCRLHDDNGLDHFCYRMHETFLVSDADITIGPLVVDAIRPLTDAPLDTHLYAPITFLPSTRL
jgi:hypothetical protein